jgi:hypothetical protein
MKRILSSAMTLLVAVLVLSGAGFVGQTSAQSTGLGITPRRDITVKAGDTTKDRLQVSNLNGELTLKLNLQIIDFGAQDESGTPSLKLDENAPQTSWSLKPFINAPKSITVDPGKTEYIDYTIAIPKDQGAGSYYSAIRYVAEGVDGGNVNITASGATLVFVTVPGQTKESLILQKFGAYDPKADNKKGAYKSFFSSEAPQKFAFTVKNQGNVAERPTGSILVKNMFGKQVKVVKDINSKSSLALIEQTRKFEVCFNEREDKADDSLKQSQDAARGEECLKNNLAPGRYTAELAGFYGINGNSTQDISSTTTFWYLPVWFLITVAVVILAIAGGIYLLYRKLTGRGSFKRNK